MSLQAHGLMPRLLVTVMALALAALALFADMPEPEPAPEATTDSVAQLPDTVSIRVLNGSGRAGLARAIQRFLMGSSGPVVFVAPFEPADADRDDYEMTIIVAHLPGSLEASGAASQLGLGDSCIVWEMGDDPETDLTIILGRDVADRRDSLIPVADQ